MIVLAAGIELIKKIRSEDFVQPDRFQNSDPVTPIGQVLAKNLTDPGQAIQILQLTGQYQTDLMLVQYGQRGHDPAGSLTATDR